MTGATEDELPILIIGAGPVGLAAAAQARGRGLPFVVLEAGDRAGAAIAEWGHVRLFSPGGTWSMPAPGASCMLPGPPVEVGPSPTPRFFPPAPS